MKEYSSPKFEKIIYYVEDCLTGSNGVESESENIGEIIDDLFGN